MDRLIGRSNARRSRCGMFRKVDGDHRYTPEAYPENDIGARRLVKSPVVLADRLFRRVARVFRTTDFWKWWKLAIQKREARSPRPVGGNTGP